MLNDAATRILLALVVVCNDLTRSTTAGSMEKSPSNHHIYKIDALANN